MKKNFSFIILFQILCLYGVTAQNKGIDTMKLCNRFVKNYKATIKHNGDTLVVSRITQPDSLVNNFLLNCAKREDFRPVKYGFVVIGKQSIEYSEKYKSDYIVYEGGGDNLYKNNGLVALVVAFIKKYEMDNDENFVLYTIDVNELMIKHRKKIPDYNYIKQHLK
jgi:hypothetical protein